MNVDWTIRTWFRIVEQTKLWVREPQLRSLESVTICWLVLPVACIAAKRNPKYWVSHPPNLPPHSPRKQAWNPALFSTVRRLNLSHVTALNVAVLLHKANFFFRNWQSLSWSKISAFMEPESFCDVHNTRLQNWSWSSLTQFVPSKPISLRFLLILIFSSALYLSSGANERKFTPSIRQHYETHYRGKLKRLFASSHAVLQ
jgi:hypothetical protein